MDISDFSIIQCQFLKEQPINWLGMAWSQVTYQVRSIIWSVIRLCRKKNENTEEHTVSYTEDNTGEANANI